MNPTLRFVSRWHPLRRRWLSLFASDTRPHSTPHVALTFDDGPHPELTPLVLDLLAQFGIRATFFLIGERVRQHPELTQRIVAEGHKLGNHSDTHQRLPAFAIQATRAELARANESIETITGVRPKRIRPPLGRITPAMVSAARSLHLELCLWSLDTGDWRCRSNDDADQCVGEIVESVRPGDVLLLHDASPFIDRILGKLLPTLIERGLVRSADAATPHGQD